MDDLISRQAAIELLRMALDDSWEPDYASDRMGDIPAADVRPVVRGKWTLNKDGSGTCSECGFVQNSCWDLDNWDNFCHHCGADMRGEN